MRLGLTRDLLDPASICEGRFSHQLAIPNSPADLQFLLVRWALRDRRVGMYGGSVGADGDAVAAGAADTLSAPDHFRSGICLLTHKRRFPYTRLLFLSK